MKNKVSGSARPCEDLLSFEVKLKVNCSRVPALPLPNPPQASKSITRPINPCARFTFVCFCTVDNVTRQHVGVEHGGDILLFKEPRETARKQERKAQWRKK